MIALRGKNGVVLAVEKIVRSPLYEEDAGARIYSIDKHIGIVRDLSKWISFTCLFKMILRVIKNDCTFFFQALAGLLADGRTIGKCQHNLFLLKTYAIASNIIIVDLFDL